MIERDSSPIVRGRRVLLGFLLSVPLVFIATWAALRNVEAKLATGEAPLVWAERAAWPTPPIKRTTLEDVPAFAGQPPKHKWERLDFDLSPEVVAVVKEAAALAGRDDFSSDAVGAALRELAARRPAVLPAEEGEPAEQSHAFYLDYLLGAWHEARGETAEAEAAFGRAFPAAPAVIKVRYETADQQPVAGLELGTAELALDRVIDGDPATEAFDEHLDQTLKLVYPNLVTDAAGTVYLPAFHTVYRWARKPEPTSHEVRYFQTEGWFQFPGRVGAPRPALVTPIEAGSADSATPVASGAPAE